MFKEFIHISQSCIFCATILGMYCYQTMQTKQEYTDSNTVTYRIAKHTMGNIAAQGHTLFFYLVRL